MENFLSPQTSTAKLFVRDGIISSFRFCSMLSFRLNLRWNIQISIPVAFKQDALHLLENRRNME